PKEPSRSRLRALQSVLKVLLESNKIKDPINRSWVRKTAHKDSDFTDVECDVVAHIANVLRPYIPRRRPGTEEDKSRTSLAHVCLRAPLAIIANTVLRMTGYVDFTRKISPQISTGRPHALSIGATGIYEVLCSEKGGFSIEDSHGNQITARPTSMDIDMKNRIFG
ncbi:hypothetical protein BGZ75_002297, partial [Mortierella antarctica]